MTQLSEPQVIVIDDEKIVREAMCQTLELEGYRVSAFEDPRAAIALCGRAWQGVVICDLRMDIMDGLEVLQQILLQDSEIPVIMYSAHADIATAIQAIRIGAYDFLEKTEDPQQQLNTVQRAWKKRQLVLENRRLKQVIEGHHQINSRLVGNTRIIEDLRHSVLQLAQVDVDLIIVGETGTGKEVVAQSLHDFSPRAKQPFVALNCGALAESVLESELFGHEAGAFTGAVKKRIGKLEFASGGTLFLDEIESMPSSVQVHLLRVLQERKLQRVGGNVDIKVDIRVVAAAKIDLLDAVAQGAFREDLYYRLSVARIDIPSLEQRKSDIVVLFRHFIQLAGRRFDCKVADAPDLLLRQLTEKPWPGNVRELRNAAERWVLGLPVMTAVIGRESQPEADNLDIKIANYECQLISSALLANNGQVELTAKALGIPRKKLYLRMKKHQLERRDFSEEKTANS